jgi:hypothetical protein
MILVQACAWGIRMIIDQACGANSTSDSTSSMWGIGMILVQTCGAYVGF